MANHVSLETKLQSRHTFLLKYFHKDVDEIVGYLVDQQVFTLNQDVYQLVTLKQSIQSDRFRRLLEHLTTDQRRRCFLHALARLSHFPDLEEELAAPPKSHPLTENTLTRADWENTDAEEAARAPPRDIHGRQETAPPLASLPGGDDPPPAYTASGSGGSTGTLISEETGADGIQSLGTQGACRESTSQSTQATTNADGSSAAAAAAAGGGDGGGGGNGSEHSSSGPGMNSYSWYALVAAALAPSASVLLYSAASWLWPGAFRSSFKFTQDLSLPSSFKLSQSLEIQPPAPPDGGSGT